MEEKYLHEALGISDERVIELTKMTKQIYQETDDTFSSMKRFAEVECTNSERVFMVYQFTLFIVKNLSKGKNLDNNSIETINKLARNK